MGSERALVKHLGRMLSSYYNLSEDDMKIVLDHSYAGAATSICPVPILTLGLNLVNQIALYKRINSYLGIRTMSFELLKVIAGIIASQVMGALAAYPAVIGGIMCGELLKFIPGAGSVCGILIGASVYGAITFVMGVVYLAAIKKLVNTNKELTKENIQEALKDLDDKETIKQIFEEAKKVHSSAKERAKTV
ncbi:MAG: hypothetical protein Q4D58_07255 [Synergistaceae bacterium]|nr:hypothetical protein [Synergistaceae bacterium]